MKTKTIFATLVIAGSLLTQSAMASTDTLAAADMGAQPQNVHTVVVTASKPEVQKRLTTAETAVVLMQRLKEEAVKELQQQVDAGSFLPELVRSTTKAILNPALLVQVGR